MHCLNRLKPIFKICLNLIFLLLTVGAHSQEINPQPMLDSMLTNFNRVKDYSADLKIKLDVDFIKIPIREAKIYYKYPDKVKMKSNGFALLPKRGLNFSGGDLLSKKYQAIYVRTEFINSISLLVIKIIPLEDNSDIILATLWVERKNQLIYKLNATSKDNGSFSIRFDYPNPVPAYKLPQRLTFDFDVTKMEIPAAISGDYNTEKPKETKKGPSRGKITLSYSNYIVNKGIPDNFFIEEKSKK
jgi:hypothetical protein